MNDIKIVELTWNQENECVLEVIIEGKVFMGLMIQQEESE
tara:strand:+ start:641 stop:760 length:120 start_codon:yes stop_codon:yes gene_type:complete